MRTKTKAGQRRLLSLLLALVMVLGMLPAASLTVLAAGTGGITGTLITDVNFKVRAPIGSEYPSFTATDDHEKVIVCDVQWVKGDTGTGKALDEDDEFKAGDWYTVKVYFYCLDYFTVSVDCTATLNGNAVDIENAEGMPGIYVTEYAFQAKDSLYAYLPNDVYWTIWGNVTVSGETGYNQLKEYIQNETVTWAIRLDSDVKYTSSNRLGMTVTGKKYLDLNGHDIDVKYDKGWTDTLFTIPEGSELVIIDSKGGGSIRYNGYIFDGADYDAGHLAVRHVFDVSGKLTINGGRILGGGRSKKQWLANAVTRGTPPGGIFSMYNGYVRNQVNGYGVIVRDGGELTVNGGDVTGRGFLDLGIYGTGTRACAIKGYSGSTITLNDGYFKGYGCADVLQIENGCDLTIKSGVFDTHKIDKVRLPNVYDDDSVVIWTMANPNQMSGSYGDIGIPEGCIVENAKVVIGGETQEADEDGNISADSTSKKTFINPEETTYSLTSYLRPVTGVTQYYSKSSDTGSISYGAWTMGTSGILEAVFDEDDYYWEQGILDSDYMKSTTQKSYVVWQIWDYFDNKLLTTIVKKSGTILNLNALYDSDGNKINIEWVNGRVYSVVAYMAEDWNGKFEYQTMTKIGQYDIQALSSNVGALGNADIVDIVQDGVITCSGHHYPNFVATVSQNTIDVLEAMKENGEIVDWYVSVSYEEAVDTVTYPVTYKMTANSSVQIYTGAPGITTVECKVYVGYASSATVVIHSQKVDLLAFSDIDPMYNLSWDSTVVPMITLLNYEDPDAYIQLNSRFNEMKDWGRNVLGGEIDYGETLDASNIYWEYLDYNGNWMKIEPNTPGMVYGSERGETNNYLYVRADATYRACYQIGEKVFTSPKPIVVHSPVDYDDYPLVLLSSSENTTYGKGATISADLTPVAGQSSNWSNNLYAVFQCVSWPDGAKIPTKKIAYQPSNASSAYNQYFSNGGLTVQTDAFFAGSESRVRPGIYTYRVTVYDEDTGRTVNGITTGQVRRTSFDVSVTYDYTATGADIYIDGENISNQTDDGCYLMPGNTNKISLQARLYPTYSTQLPSGSQTYSVEWEIVSNTSVGEIVGQGTAATFVAKEPGKATVRATVIDDIKHGVFAQVYVDIIVPIAGFTVDKISIEYGQNLATVCPNVTSVWCYGGEKVTNNLWYYLQAYPYSYPSIGAAGQTAKYNENYDFCFVFRTIGDNVFAYTVGYLDEYTIYQIDLSTLSMNTCDSDLVSTELGRGYKGYSGATLQVSPYDLELYYNYTSEWIIDPNGTYIDFISVTQTNPAVGDSAVYDPGTSWGDIKFLAGEVSFGAAPFTYSSEAYPITELVGSGMPYDNAYAEYKDYLNKTDYNWYFNAAFYHWYPEFGYDTEQVYSEGIHLNELNVYTAKGEDGTVYYFSSNVMLVVNGHKVTVNYNTGGSIQACYYFDVGEVDVFDGVTVVITPPVAGETPTTADLSLCLNYEHNQALPMYVSRLTWFIDANGNNVCDEGEEAMIRYDTDGNYDEEASGLNADGTFKYGTVYKVVLTFALDDDTTARLAPYTFKTSVYTGSGYVDAITHYDAVGAPTDAVYAYPRTANEPLTKYEATFTAEAGDSGSIYPFDPIPSNAANHFSVSGYNYIDVAANGLVGSNALEDGKEYIFCVTFRAEDGYTFEEDFTVIINGVNVSEVEFSDDYRYVYISYPFTLGSGSGTGVTVSGTATSWGSETDDVTIQLILSGTSEAAYEAVVKGNSAEYSISKVAPGTYTMKVMKLNHVTREYTVEVGSSNVTQDVKIHLLGDVTLDGSVNMKDWGRMRSHINGTNLLTDYALACADVNQDGNVNMKDWGRMRSHINGTNPLW